MGWGDKINALPTAENGHHLANEEISPPSLELFQQERNW